MGTKRTVKRHQYGSAIQRLRRGVWVWVGKYRDENGKQCLTDFDALTKTELETALTTFLQPINKKRDATLANRRTPLGEYVENFYIPIKKENSWKESTAGDAIQRLRQHIVNGELKDLPVSQLDHRTMQKFLNTKKHYSSSLVNHLRFDFSGISKMLMADGLIDRNQTEVLATPKQCKAKGAGKDLPIMNREQILLALSVLDLRERLCFRFATFAGMRPGEIEPLGWTDIARDQVTVDKRRYKGVEDVPKNGRDRSASLPTSLVSDLDAWRKFADPESAFIFGSETKTTPIWLQNLWMRTMKPRFAQVGLEWANFRCMRRTQASIMKQIKIDPKVGADQRGHGLGVSMDEYTQSHSEVKLEAMQQLEDYIVTGRKPTQDEPTKP